VWYGVCVVEKGVYRWCGGEGLGWKTEEPTY